MTEQKEPKYLNGLIVKRPHENAPDFVKCSLSFKVDEFIEALQANVKNGWVNADMKVSKGGKLYVSINDWQPKKEGKQPEPTPESTPEPEMPVEPSKEEIDTSQIPF